MKEKLRTDLKQEDKTNLRRWRGAKKKSQKSVMNRGRGRRKGESEKRTTSI